MSAAAEEESGIDLTGGAEAEAEERKTAKQAGSSSSRGRGRPSNRQQARDLKTRFEESIGEIGEWLSTPRLLGVDEDGSEVHGPAIDEELGAVLKRDAPKMSEWLAHHAEKHVRLAKVLDRLVGKGSPLGFVRAFGGVLRALQERLRAIAAARAGALEEEAPGGEEPAAR